MLLSKVTYNKCIYVPNSETKVHFMGEQGDWVDSPTYLQHIPSPSKVVSGAVASV